MSKLDHVAIRVSDLDASIAFYTKKLGLTLDHRNLDETNHEAYAFLDLEGGKLELLQLLDDANEPLPYAPPPVEKPYCPHVALGTVDMAEVLMMLNRRKIPLVEGPFEIAGSVRWVYAHDPDNNVIEFIQWL